MMAISLEHCDVYLLTWWLLILHSELPALSPSPERIEAAFSREEAFTTEF
jgi:hypothetical protein